jgi:hypothetical protein
MSYPSSYAAYAQSMIAASRYLEGIANFSMSGPSDPGIMQVKDFDIEATYYLDACPRGLEPNPLLHYFTPSELDIKNRGSEWLWSDFKPACAAFSLMAKGRTVFSDLASKLASYHDDNGYNEDSRKAYEELLAGSGYHEELGSWVDGGNSLQSLNLWTAFKTWLLLKDLRVLIAGDVVYKMGGKNCVFDHANCHDLNKLIYALFPKPAFKIGKKGVSVSFGMKANLTGTVPIPYLRLSEPQAWATLFGN